jgi:hypothetical protein
MWELDVDNPNDRAVIIAARSFGVAPTIFLGRDSGPAWTDIDRQAVLELQAWESQLCPGCHEPLAVTTAAENEFRYQAQNALLCHRCAATDTAMTQYQGHQHSSSLLIPIVLRDV